MASVPPANNQLPLLFSDLTPLSSVEHASWKARASDALPAFARQHAIPLTVDEFVLTQRFMPIVFSSGPDPIPLALMGLNEGVNIFVDDQGKLINPVYVPAYVRRYPFMLAKLQPDADSLSLCFDPTTDLIGAFDVLEHIDDDVAAVELLIARNATEVVGDTAFVGGVMLMRGRIGRHRGVDACERLRRWRAPWRRALRRRQRHAR